MPRRSGAVKVNAVVLAGGPQDDVARLQPGAPNKAFVEIAGVTLVGRVLAALRATPQVERIVVVAPPEMRGHRDLAGADELRPDGVRITESLRNGLAGFAPGRRPLDRRVGSAGAHGAGDRRFHRSRRGARRRRGLRLRREGRAPAIVPRRSSHMGANARRNVLRRRHLCDEAASAAASRPLPRRPRRGAKAPDQAGAFFRRRHDAAICPRTALDCASRSPRFAKFSVRPCGRSFRRMPRRASTSTESATSPWPSV